MKGTESECDSDILLELRQQMRKMEERIDKLENDLNSVRDKCSTSDADKLASFTLDNTESVRWNHFDIAAELNDNKVEIFIRDTNTKSI